jgi:hypothetical protein
MESMDKGRRGAELLPFYVNGTLSAEERAEVDTLLAEDDDLRWQRDVLKHIREAIKADEAAYSPGELGLARLTGAIAPRPRHNRLLAASVAAASIAVGAVLYNAAGDRGPVYEPAGLAGQDGVLLVAFRPGAPYGQVSDLLLANDMAIIDGPSAIGLYRVRISESRSQEDALIALRAASSLVESAGVAE